MPVRQADAYKPCYANVGWTVGNYCNAACGHCYSWKGRRSSSAFLTKTEADRIVGQLLELGVETVNLGGNEPIYTHGRDISATLLPYVIRSLHQAGLPTGLTTNGISFAYLDEHHHDELMMLNDIDFSLDSPFQREHDRNRGRQLYSLALRQIRRARELGLDCSVVSCGMRRSFTPAYLSAFLALTKLLDCEFRINTLKPVERSLLPQMPSAEQFYQGFDWLLRNTRAVTVAESCLSPFLAQGCHGCPCGSSSFRVDGKNEQGRVPITPCVYLHDFKTGDLLTEPIRDILSERDFRVINARRRDLPSACREADCPFAETCRGGCAARAYLCRGSMDARDPYCPLEYQERHGHVPSLPVEPAMADNDGIRVHDDYLCTWIGVTRQRFEDPRYASLEDFLAGGASSDEQGILSGCRQVTAEADASSSLAPAQPAADD